MLETLRKHNPKEVEKILSSLTFDLLPDPGVPRSTQMAVDPQLQSEIWNEIRRRLKVERHEPSPEKRGKLFEFLFAEMTQVALPQSTSEAVKAKLSFRGELRSDLYDDVRFHRSFDVWKRHGVRPNHVLEAIRNADDVEHLNLLDNEELISFFLRKHNDFSTGDPFILLVLARRSGSHVEVSDALRVYLSDVDILGAQRPFDILRRTVEKYGFFITIGDITEKLIFDRTVTIEGRINATNFVKIHALSGTSVLAKALWRERSLHNSYGIALAFALDQARYAADLRKHGVHVDTGVYTQANMGYSDEDLL